MFDWINDLLKSKPVTALFVPSGLSGFNFLGNLFIAISDGQIDPQEYSNLMVGASGLQMILLIIIIVALSKNKK